MRIRIEEGDKYMKKYYNTHLIDEFRKENELTVVEFCKLCKIAIETYYKTIKEQLKCVPSVIFKILKVLNIHMSSLYC